MQTIKAAKILIKRESVSELLPYLSYDEETNLFALDTGLGFIIECFPYFASDSTVLTLKTLFSADLPAGTSIQVMMYASPNINELVDAYVLMREKVHGNSIYSEMAKKRVQMYKSWTREPLIKGSQVILRNFRLIFSVVVPCSKTPGAYEESKEKVSRIKEKVLNTLRSSGLSPHVMNCVETIQLLNELLNPNHEYIDYIYDPDRTIKEQIIYADNVIDVEDDHLMIDGKYCRSYTVRQYPAEWDITRGISYIGDIYENTKQISAPFFIVLNTEYPEYGKLMKSLQNKAMSASYQAYGPLSKFFPKIAMKKENIDEYMVALENGDSPIYGYLHIFVYAEDIKHASSIDGTLTGMFRSMNFILQHDDYIGLPLFLMSLPMGYISESQRDLRRRKTLTTSVVAELLPIQSDWKGMSTPVIPLVSRRGQLFFIDMFENPTGGYSGIVSAATGAGKSFFVNEMIMSYLGVDSKVWVIDVGRSYEKLCKIVDGDYIVFSPESKICINPFTRVENIDEEMPILKSILAQMASRVPLDELSLSHIEEAIKESYMVKGNDMTVTDVAMYLEKGDELQQQIAKRLYPYTEKGAYASYFEGRCTLDPQKPLAVLELEELKTKKDLQEVVLLVIIFQVQQEMTKREKRKLLIIDEAWDLLTGGNTTAFIETAYRRIRKYRGACISITQSVNDFYKIPAGVAIIENSDFFFLLRQRHESIEALKKSQRVSLSEGFYDLLKSVTTDTGNYSEIFCYTPVGITIGRLIVDRFTQLLYTSKADEYMMIQNFVEKGMDIRQAIEKVIEIEEGRSR